MKKILLLLFTLFSLTNHSQSITSAEYFFDTDNGVTSGTPLTVDSNTGQLIQTFTIPTTGLTDGFHSLYVRTYNSAKNWSLYDRQTFYLKSFDTFTISDAEYFFDEDEGIGTGTPLAITAGSGQVTQTFPVSTAGLSEGFHSFYLRTKDNAGHWSLYDRQIIYIKDFDFSPDDVSAAEYFIDTDPGTGNGMSITFDNASETTQVLNIDSTGIPEGDHIFYVRVQDSNGDWSIYDSAVFTIDSNLSTEDSLFELVNLYPSPFSNQLTINTPNNIEITKTEIYNALGQTVYSSTESIKTLELSTLKSGMYILNLKTTSGKASFKIIKK
ncbi:T9SS type A sorting domain-containing protein [Algibacter sp. 2305UL17-15]|uniref:T9SS type A sorting domain-containing protein n=1 Tax=Algibacter sp. 2305UL17-15 TaxID=3231268 RepID=UPI003459B003